MKKINLFLGTVLLLGFTISCSRPVVQEELPQIVFEEAPTDYKLTDAFSKFKFIQLEQTEDCIFENVSKVVDAEGCIVVRTQIKNELFCFDRETGAFKCRIGNVGEGPGEYLYVLDFYYNNKEKSICVIDPYHNSIISYDLNGKFLHSKKMEPNINFISCVERSDDGYLMFANMLYDNPKRNNEAYTVIRPDGTYFSFDRFAPVKTDNGVTPFAMRPMATDKKGITFCKFLCDTLFRMEDGKIQPIFKLKFNQKIPSKEMLSQVGPYDPTVLTKWCVATGYFTGFDNVFETEKFILLEPVSTISQGYFWVDKETYSGIRIPSSNRMDLVGKMILEGRTILETQFSSENELVSIIAPILADYFNEIVERNPDLVPFSNELLPFLEKFDPEGNPMVIIYEH